MKKLLILFSCVSFAYDTHEIGQKIWQNECGKSVEKLIWWNQGENCASLGIGHFIWYPAGVEKQFQEQFPQLIQFLHERGVAVPEWLLHAPSCPWKTLQELFTSNQTRQMQELRTLLKSSIDLQAEFMVQKLDTILPKLCTAAGTRAAHIRTQWQRVIECPNGPYVLIDYLNFKGDGCDPKERYKGHGWGLLQVLDSMTSNSTLHADACAEFAACAGKLLEQRVRNAPPERNEQQWLSGWKKRLQTYVQ